MILYALRHLAQSEAIVRSSAISNISYSLFLILPKGLKYQGLIQISFNYSGKSDTFIDYSGAFVSSIILNGKSLPTVSFNKDRILLANNIIAQGNNIVEISFENNYSESQGGLHHFKDPKDGLEYLWTQFESINAHECFPCFDQPDIRCPLTLVTATPDKWEVVSAEREAMQMTHSESKQFDFPEKFMAEIPKGFILRVFPPTLPIPSYLYSVLQAHMNMQNTLRKVIFHQLEYLQGNQLRNSFKKSTICLQYYC